MPQTTVVLFREDDGSVPLLEWLDDLPAKVQDKCRIKIERLAELGYELRRPEADFLRDGIYELRIRHRRINYRMLYFFHENTAVVLLHGILKERVVPPKEIDRAVERKVRFARDPRTHMHQEN
jgi:phage-related protein